MITLALIILLSAPFIGLVNLLPSANQNVINSITGTLDYFKGTIRTMDLIVPFDTLMLVLTIVVTIEAILIQWRIIKFIWGAIRGTPQSAN